MRLVTISVAVTKATATTFQLHSGSVVRLGSAGPGTPPTHLLVTGILRPTGMSSAFWQYDPVLAAPALMGAATHPFWLGGALTGTSQLTGLEAAYAACRTGRPGSSRSQPPP